MHDEFEVFPPSAPDTFALSAAQRGIWFAQHVAGSTPISIAQYVEIEGDLDHDALATASAQAGREFGTGFLRIVEIDGLPYQHIDHALHDRTTFEDFRGAGDPESAARAWMQAEYTAPMDIRTDRLVAAAVLRVGEAKYFWYTRIHHIALDGFAAMTMMARAAEIYTAIVSGSEPTPAGAEDLRAVVEGDIAYRESERFDNDRAYWAEHLAGAPEAVGLVGGAADVHAHPRLVSAALPAATAALLNTVAAEANSSIAPVMVAAFGAYLARMTGVDDLTLSLPVSARTTARLRRSGGMVANVVPLRLRLDRDTTIGALIRATQNELTGALRRQRYRQEDIFRDRGMAADQAATFGPSVNIMAFDSRVELGSLVGRVHVLTSGLIEDLFVNLYPGVGGQSTHIDFQANPNLYSEADLRAHHERFLGFLQRFLAAGPDTLQSGVALLDATEHAALVPARGPESVAPMTLSDILTRGVARNPEQAAIVDGDRTLTYRELDEWSTRLARVLIEDGAGPEGAVAVALSRSLESVLSTWAVAKTGAAFLPVDPAFPADRIAHLVSDGGASIGITLDAHRAGLPGELGLLVLDDDAVQARIRAASPAAITDADRRAAIHLDQPAYVIYTSGSTGLPKGVGVTHRGIASLVTAAVESFRVAADARIAHAGSPSFDASLGELLSAFFTGATSVIVPPAAYAGAELAQVLRRHHVTHLDTPPAVLATLHPADVPQLRSLTVGGDVCPPELVARWSPQARIVNAYGPTETTITATLTDAMRPDADITVGAPIHGVAAVVLDRWLQPVPAGAAGELYLAGPGVARGYGKRFALTASRFVADPYHPGARMYRTGDLVRWTADLNLEYLGRSDFQVKIRGLRIELGEIDAGLQRHDDVAFAVTVGATTPAGAAALVSYLLPKPGATIDPADVKMFVGEFLPEYMLPAAIMVLDEVPRTPIGKLDRKALPTPDFGTRAGTSRSAATETERLLAGLFAEVLGVEAVGAEESFFALGGDSIMSIQLVSRAKAAGLSFSARDVFERKTVAALATAATRSDAVATLAELPGGGIGTFEPTPIVAAMLEQDGPFDRFGQAMLIRLPHGIDRATLTGALQAVIDRHDALRSALRVTESDSAEPGENEFGDWVIEIGEVGSVDAAALLTLVRAEADNDVRAVADVALQAAADRLDPTAGIVLQAVWIDTETEGYLWLVVHHLAVDGVSWRIILPDLATAATQLRAGETVALAPTGTSLRTWAHEQRRAASNRRAELEQWQATLDGPDPILGDRVLDVAEDLAETMGRIDIRVPAETTGAVLTTVAQRFHGGANDALLTALAMAISQWRRERDTACTSTLITLEGHGREEHIASGAELAQTVGWFTSIYPVRLDLAGIDLDDAFAGGVHAGAAIKRVKQQLREIPDNGIGFGMLRYLDGESATALAAAPSPQISFNYLGRTELGARGPWLPATDIAGPAATLDPTMPLPAVLDINAIGEDTATGTELAVTWAYASKLLSESDVRELADLWTRALEALAAHAAAPGAGGCTPSDFPLVAVSQTEIEGWEQQHPAMTDVWPLSPLQFGLLFHSLYDTDTADGYTVQATLTLAGSVDGDRLHRAAQALVDRHANLRAAFVETAAGPRQIVVGEAEVGWQERDLRASVDIDHALETVIAEDAANRFDLTRAPLLRFTLLRTGTDSYRLLMTNHHILLDGWSTPLLVQELLMHYAGGGAALPPPPAYRDYLRWLDRRDDATSIAAWARALAGVDAPTRAVPSLAGITSTETGEVSIDLGVDATTALHELGRAHGVTVNTAVQAAWAMLLHTMTGRADVVFGGTVSGRPADIDGVEQMIGLFINTLPVRVQLDPAESVADLLRRVQLEQAALLDHQHVGLTDIHAAVGLPELFDTLTVFESYPIDRDALAHVLDIAGMRVTDIAGTDATPYPLSLLAIPNRVRDAAGKPAESLTMTLKYLAGELDHAAATQVLDRLIALLHRFTADPATRVCALATDVVAIRNGAESVTATTLPEILGAAATRNPDAIALSSAGVSLTYRELDSWSNRLARVLLRHGAGPDRFVILALPRSVESVVAVWAIAKTGAAFLPLDPNHPPERIEHMVTDSRARIGVTITAQGANLPGTIDWLLLDDLATVRKTMTVPDAPITAADRGVPVHIDQTAYLIYTSGSTGQPKAVLLSHRGLANLVTAQHESLGLDPESTVLQVASPSFDASVFELLMAHGAGGRLVVAPSDVYGGDGLAELIRAQGISHAVITPSALATMEPRDVDGLRVLAVAGEAASTDLVARWAPGRTMLNLYGPTEFSVWATGGTAMTPEAPITIGSPIRGAAVLVLDDWLRPVPAGTAGELYLTGPALARGYFNRFGLTAGRFVANPHGAPGERMYRTGDIVSVNADEELEYLGRSDFQVKIRGLRIELGEIDAVLVADDAVDYVATIGQPGPSGSTVLVSYVLPMAGAELDTERLRERVAAVLPGYMVPAVVVALDEIPLTPVGKLDRKALPMPDLRTRPRSTYLAPRTPAEQTLTRVFGELLGVEQVGVDESFFDLGGNSLLATRAVARINASIDGTVALRDLFDAPTAAQLANRIDGADDGPLRPLLRPYERPQHVPLSPAQQRMWFLNRFDRDSAAYNMPMSIRLTGELDIAALHAAVADVVDRHEVLRTVYPETADGAVQVILPAAQAIPQLVVESVSESGVAQRILQLAAEPFDVTAAVPLRGALLELAPDEHVLVMVLHHIAGDGWSFAPLARDVMLAYTARLHGESPQWQPLDVQYADFALWQRELLGDEADSESLAAQQVGYWADALAGLPDQLVLPADRPRPALQTYRGGRVAFELDPATHAALDELARAHDASLFMVLHSAFAVLLARLSGSTDIAIGSPVAGRGDRMLDELIGMFVNTMVFRSAVDLSAAFTDLLAETRERDLKALAHADVPFERLVEVLDPVRTTAWHPLFQVGFSFENLAPTEFELPGLRVSQVDLDPGISQFDLHLVVVDGRDAVGAATGIEGHFTYAADIFDPDTVQGIGERFVRVLHGILADPARPVGDLALLAPAEHNRILTDWNATEAPVPSGTLADLVDAQVVRTPAATALTFAGEHLTYAELDARVNRFARYLVDLGVGPESVVALGLGRCIEQVVAMLAVCKAGGAYLPIDLDHPIERSAYVLDTAEPVCVLTTLAERDRLPSGHRTVEIDAVDTAAYAATPLTDADRRATLNPGNTAYVIFTSGSTGRPKGVAITHDAIVNQLAWKVAAYEMGADDTVLVKAPMTFDISVWEYWSGLVSGGRTVVARSAGDRDAAYLNALVTDEAVTQLHVVPATLAAMLVDADGVLSPSLRHVLVIGETLPAGVAARFRRHNDARLHNTYGPTEAAVSITAYESTDADETSVPIGAPEWNSKVYVLDARLQPVPAGVLGELYLAGNQLARGYFARPDITADRFVANPFDPAGGRMYRTGDLVAWGRTGELDYIGRTDFQVKVRGFRIELGEVETALLAQDDVAAGAVITREDERLGAQLVAYVVAEHDTGVDTDDLSRRLGAALPSYMVPNALVVLDELPLNVNGKLDRQALPAPEFAAAEFREPATAVERVVAAVFADILGVDRVGLDDDFFALGGNSLIATQAVSRLRAELGVEVAVMALFAQPTVAGLADRIGATGAEMRSADEILGVVLPIRPEGDLAPLFCVHPASGLAWGYAGLAQRIDPRRPIYGLQSPELTGAGAPASIVEFAQLYVEQIRAISPHGPYQLLGWSFGGFVVHEIAVQLRALGAEVELLAMMDPDLRSRELDPGTPLTPVEFVREFGPLLGFDAVGSVPDAAGAARALTERLGGAVHFEAEHIERLTSSYNATLRMIAGFEPGRFDGDLVFFSATQGSAEPGGGADSWRPYIAGTVSNYPIDATHDGMAGPEPLRAIAQRVQQHLDMPAPGFAPVARAS